MEKGRSELLRLATLTKEGIPRGASLIISGPPGSGKTIFTQQLILEDLLAGGFCVLVTSNTEKRNILKSKKIFEWDVSKFLENRLKVLSFTDKVRITDLGIELSEAFESKTPTLIVIDSLTLASVGIEEDIVYESVEFLIQKAGKHNADIYFVWTPTKGTEDLATKLESLVDGIIRLRLDEDFTRYFRIHKMVGRKHDPHWHQFSISNEGIKFLEKPFLERDIEEMDREELLKMRGIPEPDEEFIKDLLEKQDLEHLIPKEKRGKREDLEIVLEVHQAKYLDKRKDYVRIDKTARESLGVIVGEYVEIIGNSKIVAEVKEAYQKDVGKKMIRINKRLRNLIGVGIEDDVLIKNYHPEDL
ncbi:MAG: ATPase domain-containing protein [Candidatus Methanofastidiosia archaeon]